MLLVAVIKKNLHLTILRPLKNCILEEPGNQMSVYFCKPLLENICFRDVRSFYLVGDEQFL